MLLLIDNYDSFVHNLARYFERLGQETQVVRNDGIDVAGVRRLRPVAVVLSPGPCTPGEAGVSLDLVRGMHAEVPILGVCLGHQAIAEALGGRVVRAQEPVHGRSSTITHGATGLFAGVPSPMEVGRYHSLIAAVETLPRELRLMAWTADGVLMAFEHVRYPVYGVQFHPESILTEHGYDLIANFLESAGVQQVDRGGRGAIREYVPPTIPAATLPRPASYVLRLFAMSDNVAAPGPSLPDGLLLEGLVTTLNEDRSPHITPMGPIVDVEITRLRLRPYQISTTFQNLKRTGEGVLHVTDDVEMIARAAVGKLEHTPRLFRTKAIDGAILADACRWYAFRVDSIDDREERTEILASVVEYGRARDFFGFNRAKHAVIEAAILATRLEWLGADHIRDEFERLAVLVEKTGGRREHAAFDFLRAFVWEQFESKGSQ